MEEAKKCASPRSAARAARAAAPPPPSLGHPELDDAAAAKDDYPALEKPVDEAPPALTAGERRVDRGGRETTRVFADGADERRRRGLCQSNANHRNRDKRQRTAQGGHDQLA